MKAFAPVAALVAGIVIAGCAVHQTETPPLTGPSGLSRLLTLTATPDSIAQNGGDQSIIRITVTGPNGEAMSGVPIRLQTESNGVAADFGPLSAKNVVTGSNGVATATFTAPPAPPGGSVIGTCKPSPIAAPLPGNCVSIVATPTGSDFTTADTQSVTIRLVPQGIILPPSTTPKPDFVIIPSS